MNEVKKTMVFLSERYPHENLGVLFERNEIENLSKHFHRLLVVSSISSNTNYVDSSLPSNAKDFHYKPKRTKIIKLLSLRLIFTKIFINEIYFIKHTLKINLTFHIIGVLLAELNNAVLLSRFIKNIIRKENIKDHKILLYSFWNDYRAIAIALLKKNNKKYVAVSRSHGGDIYYERFENNYLPLKNFVINEIDALYTISDSSRDYIIKKLHLKTANVFSMKLGVKNNYPVKDYAPSDTIIIVSCAQIIEIKRVDLLVKGLKKYSRSKFIWYHIGGDWLEGKVYNLAKQELNNKDNQYKFCGLMENSAIMSFYDSVKPDLFINTSKSEGIPVSVMEAMSFGIPVIATNVGSIHEIVKDSENGFLLSPDPSAEEIADMIARFYDLPSDEKIKMRSNARNTWENEFNADKNYPDFRNEIISLIC